MICGVNKETLAGVGTMFCPTLLNQKIKKEVANEASWSVGGPLSVSDIRIKLDILDEFRNAAEEKGYS